jgi:hypothetical protein
MLRLSASFSCPPHFQPPPPTAQLPKPRVKPYKGDRIDPKASDSVSAKGRAFWDFLAGANRVFDVLKADGGEAKRRFCYWRYPQSPDERWMELSFGAQRLALQSETLLCVHMAETTVPVLAHLWADVRARERAKLLQTGAGLRMSTTPFAPFHVADGTDPAPPPYALAVLLALAQQQYHFFAKRADPPDSYTVR